MGKITSNKYDSDSIINDYGTYGSKYSSTSIRYDYGSYGGQYASQSPFNPYSSTPPKVYVNGGFVGYLTVNEYKTPSIDPNALLSWLIAKS